MAIRPCWPGPAARHAVPCRAYPGPRRAVVPAGPCHHRASCRGYGPRHDPRAVGPARRHGGPPGQGRVRPVAGLYFFLFRNSRLHFLTSQSGWMDGPTDLYFLFLELKSYIFYWAIKHRAVGPCLSRATGHGGGPGTAQCLGPCRAVPCPVVVRPCCVRAGPKCRATGCMANYICKRTFLSCRIRTFANSYPKPYRPNGQTSLAI